MEGETNILFGMSFRLVVPRLVFTTNQTCSSRSMSSVSSLSAETLAWYLAKATTALLACSRSTEGVDIFFG